MVLQGREQYLVTGPQVALPPAVGHQVDRFGGAASPDDFAVVAGMEKEAYPLSSRFEGGRGSAAQGVGGAVHIGVVTAIVLIHGLQYRQRLLGGGGIVQIDQRLVVDLLLQGWELGANGGQIEVGWHWMVSPVHRSMIGKSAAEGNR